MKQYITIALFHLKNRLQNVFTLYFKFLKLRPIAFLYVLRFAIKLYKKVMSVSVSEIKSA
jgi:hypothetical protein